MRAPAFWFETGNWRATLLRPFAALYGGIAAMRLHRRGEHASVPVICIGNLTAGGTGKTPTAIAIAAMLRDMGESPVFLTRGYGGQLAGPHRVDPQRDDAQAVGDEALLLARHAPTIKAIDRVAGARSASILGSVIVMDDGLQNPTLHKDFTLAVVDAETGIGNGFCLPAGPLRAPLVDQKRYIHAVVVMGEGRAAESIKPTLSPLPFWSATLKPDAAAIKDLSGQNVFAFAGIGRPAKFFSMLEREGAILAAQRAFGDHQPYDKVTLTQIAQRCRAENLIPVTTEKDAARISTALREACDLAALKIVPVHFASVNDADIRAALRHVLAHRRI